MSQTVEFELSNNLEDYNQIKFMYFEIDLVKNCRLPYELYNYQLPANCKIHKNL